MKLSRLLDVLRITPGRAVVILIVVLGATLAAINVWFRYATTGQIHTLWGTKAMLRIAASPRAELWDLAEVENAAVSLPDVEQITIGNRKYRIVRRCDLREARGFVHMRNSLGQDASYNFSCDLGPPDAWPWAIVFFDDNELNQDSRTVVLFDRDVKWAATSEPPDTVHAVELSEKMAAGIKTFVDEQFGEEQSDLPAK
jgi:hypothetical protein